MIHTFMHEHRTRGYSFATPFDSLNSKVRRRPRLLPQSGGTMNDTEQDLRDQLDERMRLYGPKSD